MINSELTETQVEGVGKINDLNRFLICFGTGVGKTLTGLAGFVKRKEEEFHLKLVVLCPKTAVTAWKSEIPKHTDLVFQVYTSGKTEEVKDGADVYIITYTSIKKNVKFVAEIFKENEIMLILDECHSIKNPKTVITKNCSVLREYSKCCYGFSATPLLNKIEDLFYIVNFFFPGFFSDLEAYLSYFTIRRKRMIRNTQKNNLFMGSEKDRCCPICQHRVMVYDRVVFCTGCKKKWGRFRVPILEIVDYQRLDELKESLKDIMLTSYVEMDIRFHYKEVDFNINEELLYLKAAEGLLEETKQRGFAQRLPDLQLVVDNAVKVSREDNVDYSRISGKERELIETAVSVASRNEPCLVYTTLRKSQHRLIQLLKQVPVFSRVLTLNGDTSTDERGEIAKTLGNSDVVVMTDAGVESINLQASRTIIFYDLPFPVKSFIQAVGRIARMDSKFDYQDVFIIMVKGTIDEYKSQLIKHHSEKITTILEGNANLEKVAIAPTLLDIAAFRKDLLWKTKRIKEIEAEIKQSVAF